jgi:hypothetical protein
MASTPPGLIINARRYLAAIEGSCKNEANKGSEDVQKRLMSGLLLM